MNDFYIPIHTTRTLIKAVVIAALVAITLLITCILPAEYNIDPTGIGKVLRLTDIAQASEISATLSVTAMQQKKHCALTKWRSLFCQAKA